MQTIVYIIQVSIVLAVLTLVYRLLLRREALFGLNRLMLCCNLALAFGLPLVELPDFRPAPIKVWVAPLELVVSPTVENFKKIDIQPIKAAEKQLLARETSMATSSKILWIYGLICAVLLLRLLWQLTSLLKLVLNSEREKSEGFWLVKNEKIEAPFSFFRWVFYNPTLHSKEEEKQILAHEAVHISQLHSVDMMVVEIVKIFLWFNPFAWWHQRLVQENLEFLADRQTLCTGIDRRLYQLHLLKSITKTP